MIIYEHNMNLLQVQENNVISLKKIYPKIKLEDAILTENNTSLQNIIIIMMK